MSKYRFVLAVALIALISLGLTSNRTVAQVRASRTRASDAEHGDRPSVTFAAAKAPTYQLDMQKLGIRPSAVSMEPDSAGVAAGGAQMSVSPEIVPINRTDAVGVVGSGFTPGENVGVYINGSSAANVASDTNGVVGLTITTPGTTGFVLIEFRGATSGKRVAGVTEVSATGPFLPGIAAGPHALNTTVNNQPRTLLLTSFPASSSVTIKRNGVTQASGVPMSPTGSIQLTTTQVNNSTSSGVVFTAQVVGTPNTMAGVSVEERSDAGTIPSGDQNISRAFVDRAVINSASGASVAYVGEGFTPGETVTASGCVAGGVADANGVVSGTVGGAVAGPLNCVLTGSTSSRVAYFAVLLDPQATNIRSVIASPAYSQLGGTVKVLATGFPANSTGNIFVDGVSVAPVTTDASGSGSVIINKPANSFAHAVEWITSTGLRAAAPLMLNALTASEVSLSGRVTAADGRGITNAAITVSGGSLAQPVTVLTGRLGNFTVEGLTAGGTYTVSVAARRFSFDHPTQVMTLNDNAAGVDFTASSPTMRGR